MGRMQNTGQACIAVQAADRDRGRLRAVRRGPQAGVLAPSPPATRPTRRRRWPRCPASGRPQDLHAQIQDADRQGRHGRRRRRAPRPRRARSSSRRSSPTSPRRCGPTARSCSAPPPSSTRSRTPTRRSRWPTTATYGLGATVMQRRPRPRAGGGRAARGRHGVDQPAHRLLPRAALRRREAVRLRPRALRAGHVRVRQPAAGAHACRPRRPRSRRPADQVRGGAVAGRAD